MAGGASDIGNSQERNGHVRDTTHTDSNVIIIDIVNGTIYNAGEAPFPR